MFTQCWGPSQYSRSIPPAHDFVLVAGDFKAFARSLHADDRHIGQSDLVGGGEDGHFVGGEGGLSRRSIDASRVDSDGGGAAAAAAARVSEPFPGIWPDSSGLSRPAIPVLPLPIPSAYEPDPVSPYLGLRALCVSRPTSLVLFSRVAACEPGPVSPCRPPTPAANAVLSPRVPSLSSPATSDAHAKKPFPPTRLRRETRNPLCGSAFSKRTDSLSEK